MSIYFLHRGPAFPVLKRRLTAAPFHHVRAACPISSPYHRWSPPPEPSKPPVPYKIGFSFTARPLRPPPPFLGQYARVPAGDFAKFIDSFRLLGDDYLKTTTLVDSCYQAAENPLHCQSAGKPTKFQVAEELSVGDGPGRGLGSQVVVCTRHDFTDEQPLVAKIYDPLYYPFEDDDFPGFPNDVVARAEDDFALESAAYGQLDKRLGGILIPKFYGSWIIDIPLRDKLRPVGFVLLEKVKGVPLDTLNPASYTREERLRIVSLCLEADVELFFSGVSHDDIAPRNIICSTADFQAPDLSIRVIDFDVASVLPILGKKAPCEYEQLPWSLLDRYRRYWPVDLTEWIPEGWEVKEWKMWLKETWGGSSRYRPVTENP